MNRQSWVLYVAIVAQERASAACYLLRWVIDQGMRADATERQVSDASGAMFVAARDLAIARSDQPFGKGQPQRVKDAIAASILLIDDMGAEHPLTKQPLEDVIAERYDRGAITWVIRLASKRETFRRRYSGGTERRITEGNTWISLADTKVLPCRH